MHGINAPEWAENIEIEDQSDAARALRQLVCIAGPVASGCAALLELTQLAQIAARDGLPPPLEERHLQALQDMGLASSQWLAQASRDAADVLQGGNM